MNSVDDKARFRRVQSERAVQLAMQSKWEEALTVNRAIIDVFPNDSDSFNRLGKALMELGRYGEARKAYGRSLEIDGSNAIAKRNLERLATLKETTTSTVASAGTVDPRLFIEETGKTGVAPLTSLIGADTIAKLTVGEPISLRPNGKLLQAISPRGEILGDVEPRIGLRILSMMAGGNRYIAAISGINEGTIEIIMRETFQHPSQSGKVSFPSRGSGDTFRAYTRDSVLRYEADEDEENLDDPDYDGTDWDENAENNTPDEVGLDFEDDGNKDDEFDN